MKIRKYQFILTIVLTVIVSTLTGCASVKYDKLTPTYEVDKENYGIPFYEAKPFILVKYHTDDNGNRIGTPTIISLPDKTKPYKARVKGWFGNASVTVNLSNGVLVSTAADFKTDDTLAGLLGAIGTAAKVPAEIKGLPKAVDMVDDFSQPTTVSPDPCPRIVTRRWWNLMNQAETLLTEIDDSSETETQKDTKNTILNAMKLWKDNICYDESANFSKNDPNQAEGIIAFQTSIEKFKRAAGEIIDKIAKYSDDLGCDKTTEKLCINLHQAGAHVAMILEEFERYLPQKTELPPPPFELYVIEYDEAGVFIKIQKVFPITE